MTTTGLKALILGLDGAAWEVIGPGSRPLKPQLSRASENAVSSASP